MGEFFGNKKAETVICLSLSQNAVFYHKPPRNIEFSSIKVTLLDHRLTYI